jgi:prepilin-type N-terminal cleavage/methylation domain-containing protein
MKSFTLLEILITVAIFGVAMVLVSGTFLRGAMRQRELIEVQNVADNLRAVMEIMTREMRMAKRDKEGVCLDVLPTDDYRGFSYCLVDISNNFQCNSGTNRPFSQLISGEGIKFLNYKNECVVYFKDGDFLKKGVKKVAGFETATLSSANVKIETLNFWLRGESPKDQLQPRVVIVLKGVGKSGKTISSISTQTTVSLREVDTP